MANPLVIIGTGPMAAAYASVLRAQNQAFCVVARSQDRARAFAAESGAVGHRALDDLEARDLAAPVVVCTTPGSLAAVTGRLLEQGAAKLLIEKPGAMSAAGLDHIQALAKSRSASVRIATNRRLFPSVQALHQVLREQRPLSAHFDFTEWSDRVAASGRDDATLARWAVANSVHVIDTVAFLLGPLEPERVLISDQQALPWHPSGATFAGCGRCGDAPVTWSACWVAPGRHAIEVRTLAGRYRLEPMETLLYQEPGTTTWSPVRHEAEDPRFKPGVLATVDAFLSDDADTLPDAGAFARSLATAETLAGYAS